MDHSRRRYPPRCRPSHVVGVAMAAMLLWGAACSQKSSKPPEPASVTIKGYTWRVELALTPDQHHLGLSGREDIEVNRGMLFIFDQPQELSFWMQGCRFPIDVAFIGPDLRVVSVYSMAVEPDYVGRQSYTSGGPALYAFEVRGGLLQQAGVKAGDQVTFHGIGSNHGAGSN